VDGPIAPAEDFVDSSRATRFNGFSDRDAAFPPLEAKASSAMNDPRADRNLLLGILALQMDFITRDALIAAMNAWVLDKARTLGEILLSQRAIDPADLAALEQMVARHVARHGGDPEQSLAALSSVTSVVDALRSIADPDIEASVRSLAGVPDHDRTMTLPDPPPPWSGVRYRKVRDHAEGGLGVVYVAHDVELNRSVALKEIKPVYADDPSSRTRFVVEAEVTGGLEHPGIVPVYGLGSYGDGRPFYAMRFIRGDSLKDAIAEFHKSESPGRDHGERILSLQKLLRRFLDVCNAIEYAHSRGILHRDLKPNNVMVGKYGETLVVDWGLAKSVNRSSSDEPLPETTLRPSSADGSAETLPGSVVGTPGYMSPEQAAGRIDLLGPASDVYSLGATLYALLTGRAPFTSRDKYITIQQAQRGEFPKPREVVGWLDPALEAVCLKAMALKPEDRYRSPRALASDIERWIADEPVSVRREPFSERVRRWVKRNRTLVTGVAAALLASVVGLSALAAQQSWANRKLNEANVAITKAKNQTEGALAETREAKKATEAALGQSEESRKQAEAVSNLLVASFRRPDPSVDGEKIRVAEVLDRSVESLDKEFTGTAATRGAMLNALGETYNGLGLYDKAVATHAKARAVREAALGPDHSDTLTSRNNLAEAYRSAGRASEAIRMHQETLKLSETKLGPDHPNTLKTRNNLANAYGDAGRTSEAIRMHEETLKLRESKLGPDHLDTLTSRNNLATAYQDAGRTSDAIRMHQETLKLSESKLGPDHPSTLSSRNNLANAYLDAGRTSEAIRMDEETLKLRESKLGPDHPGTLIGRTNLANAYRAAGRTSEAIRMDEETLKLSESKLGPDHPNTLSSRNNLANAYGAAGRTSDAIRMYEDTLKLRESKLGPDHPNTLSSRNNLAAAYWAAGRTSEAIQMHQETLKLSESKLGPDHPTTLISRSNLAVAYDAAGRTGDAVRMHEGTLKLFESKFGPDHPNTLTSRAWLALGYESLGRWAEAEQLHRETLARRRKTEKPDSPLLAGDLGRLGLNLLNQSKWPEAETLLHECLAIREKTSPDDWSRYSAMSQLGGALLGQGKYAEAEPRIVPGYEGMKAREARIPARSKTNLAQAAERVVRLYEAWGKTEKATEWKARLGLGDLPPDVFARP
jgi:serine/threonine protein kinase